VENFKPNIPHTMKIKKIFKQCFPHVLGILLILAMHPAHAESQITPELLKAASSGNAAAQAALATAYGKQSNLKKAKKWAVLSAKQGNAQGEYALAICLFEQKPKEAVELIKSAAKKGEAKAKFLLGRIFLWGEYSHKQDSKKAEFYLQEAASAGNIAAIVLLGQSYFQGNLGLGKDLKKATQYLEMAHNMGELRSYMCLLQIYIIDKDLKKALSLAECLSEKNVASAKLYLADVYANGIEGIPVNEKKSLQLRIDAADSLSDPVNHQVYLNIDMNNIQVLLDAAKIYTYPSPLGEKDVSKSIPYLQAAADLDDAQAQFNLGEIYWMGDDKVKQNIDLALSYFEKSANKNNIDALYCLGYTYLDFPSYRSPEKAHQYLLRGSELGSSRCDALLGVMYQLGRIPSEDCTEAKKYLSRAVKAGVYIGHEFLYKTYKHIAQLAPSRMKKCVEATIIFLSPALLAHDKEAILYYGNLLKDAEQLDEFSILVLQQLKEMIPSDSLKELQ